MTESSLDCHNRGDMRHVGSLNGGQIIEDREKQTWDMTCTQLQDTMTLQNTKAHAKIIGGYKVKSLLK